MNDDEQKLIIDFSKLYLIFYQNITWWNQKKIELIILMVYSFNDDFKLSTKKETFLSLGHYSGSFTWLNSSS